MKRDCIKLSCDICGKKESVDSIEESRWIELSLENRHEDRSWYEKHLCPSCTDAVVGAVRERSADHV